MSIDVIKADYNDPAKQAYINFGFEGCALDPEKGRALFWEKSF